MHKKKQIFIFHKTKLYFLDLIIYYILVIHIIKNNSIF